MPTAERKELAVEGTSAKSGRNQQKTRSEVGSGDGYNRALPRMQKVLS